MKKYLLLLLTLFALNSCEEDTTIIDATADTLEKRPEQITICHYNKGNDTWKTIQVSEKQLQKHLDHGDRIGECREGYTYVPDDAFERTLFYYGYDDVKDDYVLTSNINTLTSLRLDGVVDGGDSVGDYFLYDLTGLQDFTSLQDLTIQYSRMTTIDLKLNPGIEELHLFECGLLSNLDVSENKNLTWLTIYYGSLSNLDLSNNIALEHFFIASNPITGLDLSNNIALTEIIISDLDNLTALNLKNGNNDNLIDPRLNRNPLLTCIEVDNVDDSTASWTQVDPWATFSTDCSSEPERTYVPDDGFEQHLINKGYDEAPLDNYVLTSNIENITQLFLYTVVTSPEGVRYKINNLLGIEDFISLTSLDLESVELTALDLSKNTALTNLSVSSTALSELDIKNNLNLTSVAISMGNLGSIDLSNNIKIQRLLITSSSLESLDLSGNTELNYLWIGESLTPTFKKINLKNGTNKTNSLDFLYTYRVDHIFDCIQVDDPTWSATTWTQGPESVLYSEDCGF